MGVGHGADPGCCFRGAARGPAAQSLPVATGTHGHLCPSLPKQRLVAWLGRPGLRLQQWVVAGPAQGRRKATSPATLRRRVAAFGQGRLCSSMSKLAWCRTCCSSWGAQHSGNATPPVTLRRRVVATAHGALELYRAGPACEANLWEPSGACRQIQAPGRRKAAPPVTLRHLYITHIRNYIYIYINTYISLYIYVYLYTYIYIYIHILTHDLYACISIRIHTYTYT